MEITFILALIQAGIKVAPDVAKFVLEAKSFATTLFGSGLITVAQQEAIHSRIDVLAGHVNAGTRPPEYTVDADPS